MKTDNCRAPWRQSCVWQIPLTVCAMRVMPQDVHLAVPRLLSHRAIPDDDVVMAMGYWAVLDAGGFTVSRSSSPACKGSRKYSAKYFACKNRRQIFWHDWVYAGSLPSIAKLAQVHRGGSYMLNLTTRCIGLCPEEQTVLQLQARGVHLSPLGWRNITIQHLSGNTTSTVDRPTPTAGRLGRGYKGPCSTGRAVLARDVRVTLRLLNPLTEWTKCVFTITAEAVEAENLFFLLGGPTSSTST